MKNIVIINAYGYQNIGDAAILEAAIKTIHKTMTKKTIHIHTVAKFTKRMTNNNFTRLYLHPYGVAIKNDTKPISSIKKVLRFTTVVSISLGYSVLGKLFLTLLPEKGDYAYIRSLKEADIVFGIGGGYLRTKNKYKDYFGLLLTLLPIFIAHLYHKRILYLPMSYGNFASSTHEKIAFQLIKNDAIIFRDEISLHAFSKHTEKQLDTYLIPDLALFDTYIQTSKHAKNYIVLTARQWMNELKQKKYENDLALFIEYVWKAYQLKTIFIPMVASNIEDDDTKVGKRIQDLVKHKNICTIYTVYNPLQVKKILANATLAICTRMHAAILSTIVKTPFITIAYEYKTVGFLRHLELEKWNIEIERFSFSLLKEMFDDLMIHHYQTFTWQLNKNHTEIKKREGELLEIVNKFVYSN